MIPKIIHQIWVGPQEMPDKIARYCENTKKIFKDHEYKFWSNDNLPELPEDCKKVFSRYTEKPAFQADILRYFVVNKYGGIYLDSDFECYEKFDHVFEKSFFCVNPNGNSWHVCNGVFACAPNSPILTNILNDISSIKGYFGPLLLSKYILDYMNLPYKTDIKKNAMDNTYIQCEGPEKFFRKNQGYCFHDALRSWLPNRKRKEFS